MERIHIGSRGLGLLMALNWDRILYVATIAVALGVGAFLGTFFV